MFRFTIRELGRLNSNWDATVCQELLPLVAVQGTMPTNR
jgi:hypothetical protein